MIERMKQTIDEKKEWVREHKRKMILCGIAALIYLSILYYVVLVLDGIFRGRGIRYLLPLSEVFKLPPKEVM